MGLELLLYINYARHIWLTTNIIEAMLELNHIKICADAPFHIQIRSLQCSQNNFFINNPRNQNGIHVPILEQQPCQILHSSTIADI